MSVTEKGGGGKAIGARVETETINRALDAVPGLARFRTELDRGLDKMVGGGGFTDHFGGAAAVEPAAVDTERGGSSGQAATSMTVA